MIHSGEVRKPKYNDTIYWAEHGAYELETGDGDQGHIYGIDRKSNEIFEVKRYDPRKNKMVHFGGMPYDLRICGGVLVASQCDWPGFPGEKKVIGIVLYNRCLATDHGNVDL